MQGNPNYYIMLRPLPLPDLDFLDGGAEIGRVLDGLEVVDHSPDDLEPVGDALERLDQLPPGGLDPLLELLELALLRAIKVR